MKSPNTALHDAFKEPGHEYGPVLFWSLNDDLKAGELRRQIRAMAAQKVGGVFMHSRVGLITPYLSKKWMSMIGACVDEARKVGLDAWIYDEDSYPSGFAGGRVTDKNPDFRAVRMIMHDHGNRVPPVVAGDIFFAGKRRGRRLLNMRRLDPDRDGPRKNESVLSFRVAPHDPSSWFNDGTYIDTRNPEAVSEFIHCTYDAYGELFSSEFGKTIPGVFTDEPHFAGSGPASMCWSRGFPEYFRKKKGYSILDHLPAVFLDVSGCERIRYDYWDCAGTMFVENFCKPIYDWCDKHGLKFTGHFWEHGFAVQHSVGSVMPCYEYMQVPGIDCLGNTAGRSSVVQYGNVTMVKEVSSVAHQLDRKRVLSESYGGGGWAMDFEEQKLFTDWECVLGINLINPHLSLYSLRGCRKRDFPPSFNFHQPWWKHYRVMNEYVSRLCGVLSEGMSTAEILVIHPISSAWLTYNPDQEYYNPDNLQPLEKLNAAFERVLRTLMEEHYEYDLGDEKLMEKHGSLRGKKLTVGSMAYSAVMIPPCRVLRKSTLALLKGFAAKGGKIISVGRTPTMIDGIESDELKKFMKSRRVINVNASRRCLAEALAERIDRGIAVADRAGREARDIYCHVRNIHGRRTVFMVNLNKTRSVTAHIELKGVRSLEKWDCETGDILPLASASRGRGMFNVKHVFAPRESLLLMEGTQSRKSIGKPRSASVVSREVMAGKWAFRRDNPNALTLDKCRYRIEKGRWSGVMRVLKAQKEVRAHYGLDSLVDNKAVQFWKSYRNMKKLPARAIVELEFVFESGFVPGPEEELCLVVETPENFSIRVNNKPPRGKDRGWWIDPSFRKLNIARLVKKDQNRILLKCRMRQDIEFDSIYVVGDFALHTSDARRFVLTGEKATIGTGAWPCRGYPFYAGTMSCWRSVNVKKRSDRRYVLEFENTRASSVRVLVNGKEAGIRCWAPWSLNVTELLKNGANTVELQLTNSLRNLLGPHHNPGVENGLTGPRQFLDERKWSEKYVFEDYGLLGDVSIAVLSTGKGQTSRPHVL